MTVHGLDANADRPHMETLKNEEIAKIKAVHNGYERKSFISSEPMYHYAAYYKRFDKTYHVLLHLEPVLLKTRGFQTSERR